MDCEVASSPGEEPVVMGDVDKGTGSDSGEGSGDTIRRRACRREERLGTSRLED